MEDREELLKNLHVLGVCLWYEGMEGFGTLVLNPEWISHGVYQVINWVHGQKRYSLGLEDFKQVFKKNAHRFPADKHKFLFDLMKAYDMAYETEEGGGLIIPHLLGDDRPEVLPSFPVGESLMLRYRADHPLPPDTISRFIVRHNREIKKEKEGAVVWRSGVVLEDGTGGTALVREENRTISVSVKGGDKTAYISRLRETLNGIFKGYKSEKPELQYSVERFGEIPGGVEGLWLPDRKILNHHLRNISYYDDITGQYISLTPIVNQYKINAGTVLVGNQIEHLTLDKSKHFNFHDCNVTLQGNLNELVQLMEEGGHEKEAKELVDAAGALGKIEQYNDGEKVKKSGVLNRVRRLLDALEDESTPIGRAAKGISSAVGITRDIAKGYNAVAQWVGLPQVPKPFLK